MPIRVALIRRGGVVLLIFAATTLAVHAQQQMTAADYARAERFMSYNTTPLVLHSAGRPTWISDEEK